MHFFYGRQDRQVCHVPDFWAMKWRQRTKTDDNWRLLQFLNKFTSQVMTLHRTMWRPDDIVTAQVTTREDLLMTRVTAPEDLLTTKLKALDDILMTLHDNTDDLLDDTDNLWYKKYNTPNLS